MQIVSESSQTLLLLGIKCEGWESGKTTKEKTVLIHCMKGSWSHSAVLEQTWNSSASLPCFSVIFHAVPSSALKCPFLWLFIGYHTPSAAQRALLAALGTGWQHAQPPCPAHGSATHTSRYPLGYPAWAAFTTCSPHRWAGTHEAQGLGWLALP